MKLIKIAACSVLIATPALAQTGPQCVDTIDTNACVMIGDKLAACTGDTWSLENEETTNDYAVKIYSQDRYTSTGKNGNFLGRATQHQVGTNSDFTLDDIYTHVRGSMAEILSRNEDTIKPIGEFRYQTPCGELVAHSYRLGSGRNKMIFTSALMLRGDETFVIEGGRSAGGDFDGALDAFDRFARNIVMLNK